MSPPFVTRGGKVDRSQRSGNAAAAAAAASGASAAARIDHPPERARSELVGPGRPWRGPASIVKLIAGVMSRCRFNETLSDTAGGRVAGSAALPGLRAVPFLRARLPGGGPGVGFFFLRQAIGRRISRRRRITYPARTRIGHNEFNECRIFFFFGNSKNVYTCAKKD